MKIKDSAYFKQIETGHDCECHSKIQAMSTSYIHRKNDSRKNLREEIQRCNIKHANIKSSEKNVKFFIPLLKNFFLELFSPCVKLEHLDVV